MGAEWHGVCIGSAASATPAPWRRRGDPSRSERRTHLAPEGLSDPGGVTLSKVGGPGELGSQDPGSDQRITGVCGPAGGGLRGSNRQDAAVAGRGRSRRRDLGIHCGSPIRPFCSWTVFGTCPAYTAPGIRVTGVRPRGTPSRSSLKSKSALARPSGRATIQDVEPRRGLLGSRIDGWGFRVATATATAFVPSLRTGRTSGHPGSSLPGQHHESGTQEWMARTNPDAATRTVTASPGAARRSEGEAKSRGAPRSSPIDEGSGQGKPLKARALRCEKVTRGAVGVDQPLLEPDDSRPPWTGQLPRAAAGVRTAACGGTRASWNERRSQHAEGSLPSEARMPSKAPRPRGLGAFCVV